jgi:hypothetical protein
MQDISYNFGNTAPSHADRPVASRVDGKATYWQLQRGYAGRSTRHIIYTADGQTIRAANADSALRKLAQVAA